MKFKQDYNIKMSGDSRLPNSLKGHFLEFVNNMLDLFSDTFKNEKVKFTIEEEQEEKKKPSQSNSNHRLL